MPALKTFTRRTLSRMTKKILLVDDSPTAILWQRMILEEDKYEIVVATDGEEGIRVARAEKPHCGALGEPFMYSRTGFFSICSLMVSMISMGHLG